MNLSTEHLLSLYESLFNNVNQGTGPNNIYPGAESLKSEYTAIKTPEEADLFFAKFGVGNVIVGAHNPFERQLAYEILLQILNSLDPVQYQKIHKGTPYYFIGWTTYQYHDFAKAIFYMDAAVSEDLKFPDVKAKTSTRPAVEFMLLNLNPGPAALNTQIDLVDVFNSTLRNYNSSSGSSITINRFRSNFIDVLLYSDEKGRSLLTALYTFILEYQEKEKQINLRSNSGGSIQPFLDHLFDGARILESLLEMRGGGGDTLRPKIQNTAAISVSPSVLLSRQTLASAESEYLRLVAARSSFQDCNFASSFIIRNTTGHSLLWPDQFTSVSSFTTLYNTLVNSIFWTIEKLWL